MARRTSTTKYTPPKWFRALPQSKGHGSSIAQRKLWKLVSDTVRQREFQQYTGKCVSCWRRLDDWRDGQAAHYKAWSVCNGPFKYEMKNLGMSCGYCNYVDDGAVGHAFGEELKRRYGPGHLEWIEQENLKHAGEKLDDQACVRLAAQILGYEVH